MHSQTDEMLRSGQDVLTIANVHIVYRGLLAFLLTALITSGCDRPSRPYDLHIVGCGTARIEQVPTPRSTVLDATVSACPGVGDPAARVARIVWLGSSSRVESIRVRIAGPRSAPVMVKVADLEEEHGANPRDSRDPGQLAWLLLPPGLAIAVGAAVLVARTAARAGFLVFFASRR